VDFAHDPIDSVDPPFPPGLSLGGVGGLALLIRVGDALVPHGLGAYPLPRALHTVERLHFFANFVTDDPTNLLRNELIRNRMSAETLVKTRVAEAGVE